MTAHRCFKMMHQAPNNETMLVSHSGIRSAKSAPLISGQRAMPNRVNQFRFANCPEKTLDQASRTLWPREPIYLRPDDDSFLTVPRHALRCARKGTADKRRKF
jgi:hypothetical protein